MKSETFPNSYGFKYLDKHGRERGTLTPVILGFCSAVGGQGDAGIWKML